MAKPKYNIATILKKLRLREIFAVLLLLSAVYFFRQQQEELKSIGPAIKNADSFWLWIGIGVTVLYILLQSAMYVYSFSAVKSKISWLLSIELFLKRNLLSVFLPAGGVTSLAYMPASLRKTGIHKQEVHNASAIYGFIGFLSIILVGIPILLYAVTQNSFDKQAIQGIIYLTLFLVFIIWFFIAVRRQGKVFNFLVRKLPFASSALQKMAEMQFTIRGFTLTTLASVGVEACGIFHLVIATLALGLVPSLQAACVGYIVSVILLFTSPFLRGLGAVEVSLVFILTRYGYTSTQALEITILYRIFEFWLPLLAGVLSYAAQGRKLFLRIAPAFLIFFLGVVNIFSAITPPIRHRIFLLKQYVDTDVMHASNLLTILLGLLLLITAAYLIKGLKAAWIIAVTVTSLSLIMNLTKALDYEEASLALIALLMLLVTYRQYRLKSSRRNVSAAIITSLIIFSLVVLIETIGFYFLQKKHFHYDFTWADSLKNSLQTFFLFINDDMRPVTKFGKDFIITIHTLSAGTLVYLVFTIFRSSTIKPITAENDGQDAADLLEEFGTAAVDHFKLSPDKSFYFSPDRDAVIAYRLAGGFAVVLDEPVCAEENKIPMLQLFDKECRKNGWKLCYYRVDEDSLYYFDALKKNKLFIGQEAVLQIEKFTLEGKDKKSMRNGLNSLAKKGFSSKVHLPPQMDEFVAELEDVSNEWLADFNKTESVFSQGMFDAKAIKEQTIIALHDTNGATKAFLNVIPDYTPQSLTYDMIRKTADAPGAAMDALIIELIAFARAQGLLWLNLGLVPLSGIEKPDNTAERVVKFAYEKVKRFQHYQGLRDFKAKYASEWINKYLVYDNDFDLVQLPAVLNKVMQPLVEETESLPGEDDGNIASSEDKTGDALLH